MAESEFYMQCEEEELAPCQNNTGETNSTGNTDHGKQHLYHEKNYRILLWVENWFGVKTLLKCLNKYSIDL